MNSWIPYPVAVVWAAAFVLVALIHLAHVAVMGGRHRLWHIGHVVMAVGMLVMFWPAEPLLGIPAEAGFWAYAVAAGALTFGLVIGWWRRVRVGRLWLASVVDFAAMAYMFTLMSGGLAWLSVVATVWFAAQTLGWVSGWLTGVLDRGGLGDHGQVPHAEIGTAAINGAESPDVTAQSDELNVTVSGAPTGPPDSKPAGGVAIASRVTRPAGGRAVAGIREWSVRATLAVMAAGMGYMMLAMQFGEMAAMSGDVGHM